MPLVLEHADRARLHRLGGAEPKTRAERAIWGQFMTPAAVAQSMAHWLLEALYAPESRPLAPRVGKQAFPKTVRFLDLGAGLGSLTAALVDQWLALPVAQRPKRLEAVVLEKDPALQEDLISTLDACAQACQAAGVAWQVERIEADVFAYLLPHDGLIAGGQFDAVILNPPYAKISAASDTRQWLETLGLPTNNLYSAFVGAAIRQLRPHGVMTAITPRSFSNGTSFAGYRDLLIRGGAFLHLHTHHTRNQAFQEDSVLQETIITTWRKDQPQPATVVLSEGDPGHPAREEAVAFELVVHPDDASQYIRWPLQDTQMAAQWVKALPCTLGALGLAVSTGRVVDFRVRRYLRPHAGEHVTPLLYPCHVQHGRVVWPRTDHRKPNGLMQDAATEGLMLPQGHYVLVKRFSAKEEPRRVVAAWLSNQDTQGDRVAIENHLNVFHALGKGMPATLAAGITHYLNSGLVEAAVRQFSGHTQVNAADLKNLRYPSKEVLMALGKKKFKAGEAPDPARIDAWLQELVAAEPQAA